VGSSEPLTSQITSPDQPSGGHPYSGLLLPPTVPRALRPTTLAGPEPYTRTCPYSAPAPLLGNRPISFEGIVG
jgi:hypothetical protein